jgi:hypothetical protein
MVVSSSFRPNWADADILNHLRQPGDHVRGYWVIDALLGKN